jgi:hypothetical protein
MVIHPVAIHITDRVNMAPYIFSFATLSPNSCCLENKSLKAFNKCNLYLCIKFVVYNNRESCSRPINHKNWKG